jgi:hypothetical protein
MKIAVFIVVLVFLSGGLGPVYAKSFIPPDIDVWTDKGGKGLNMPGGTYQVGEYVTIYYSLSHAGDILITVSGPSGSSPSKGSLPSGGNYSLALGVAEERHVGQWQVIVEVGVLGTATNIDTTWFSVVSAPSVQPMPPPAPQPQPPPTPQPQPPPTSPPVSPPPQTGEGSATTFDAEGSTELLALMALRMAEGVLVADPRMDVDNDGEVTTEDVRLILQWAVKGPEAQPSQPAGQDDQIEIQIPDTVQDDQITTQKPDTADAQALLGKWEMTRQSIQPALPPFVPEFVINQIIPVKSTWIIERVGNDVTIKYGRRDTWYKKLFLGNGITEGPATASVGNQGTSCVFQTPVKFYWESLPFPLGLVTRDMKEIQGSFTDSVNVSVSGNDIQAMITTGNIQGTYSKTHKDGRVATEPIHYNVKIVYQGTKK